MFIDLDHGIIASSVFIKPSWMVIVYKFIDYSVGKYVTIQVIAGNFLNRCPATV